MISEARRRGCSVTPIAPPPSPLVSRSPMSRGSSVTRDSRQRLSDQISLQSERLQLSRHRSPSVTPGVSRRWSSILTHDTIPESHTPTRLPSLPPPSPALSSSRQARPSSSSSSLYTSALIKHSQNLRERSMSPTAQRTAVHIERPETVYKSNQDYYRGKVRSVYEKEPMFKEFVRNIPLTETNFYEARTMSSLKQRFSSMMTSRHGPDVSNKNDPFIPPGRFQCSYEPRSGHLSRKHSQPRPPPSPSLPVLYIYHRNSRKI